MRARFKLGLAVAVALLARGADAAPIDDANAGVIAAQKGQYDEAIEKFTNAINADGLDLHDRAQAYAYRGIAKATVGDFDGAQEDLNYSVALNSDYNGDAYAFRGYFRMLREQAKEGAADLAKSAEIHIWPYNVLWLYIARLKSGTPDEGPYSLSANANLLNRQINREGTSDLARWPGPVVKFMMGQMTEPQMRAAANEGDPVKLNERVCDVDFYGAELDLARGRVAAAKPKLQAALEKCPRAAFERMGASVELSQLK
jgi:lipoprotein NlpI